MTRPTNLSHFMTTPSAPAREEARHLLSDADRMARGRAQIAAGDYVDVDDVAAYFRRPKRPPTGA